jgi:ATP-dependent helicase/nuclease subunit A
MIEKLRQGLSKRQQAALELHTDAVMSAGAGAGKTRTLVHLVCRDLLVDGVDPERVAVCTFTRASAASLTDRVSGTLIELGAEASAADDLWIGTIDALCQRLLRERAIEAGISPAFQVADELLVADMRQAAVEQALDEATEADLHLIDSVIDATGEQLGGEILAVHETLRQRGGSFDRLAGEQPIEPEGASERLASAIAELLESGQMGKTAQAKLTEDMAAVLARDPLSFSNAKYGLRGDTPVLIEQIATHRALLIDGRAWPIRCALARLLMRVDELYGQAKRAANCVDFTDLVELAGTLVAGGRGLFDRVYVDEAQDTNALQLATLQAMIAPGGRFLSVGDASQSIYGFRGADVDGFRRQRRLASAHVTLDENYRSDPQIVAAVNVICGAIDGLSDDMVQMQAAADAADMDARDEPHVHIASCALSEYAPDAHEEALRVLPHVLDLARRRNIERGEIAVLCRSNGDCEAYARALTELGVPVSLSQRRGLLRRPAVLDCIAYLAALSEPGNEQALVRVLSSPFVALSDDQIMALRTEGLDLLEAAAAGHEQLIAPFISALDRARNGQSASELLRDAVDAHDLDVTLALIDPTGGAFAGVQALIELIERIQRETTGPALRPLLTELERHRQLDLGSVEPLAAPDAVRVMTIHNAKGDEFELAVCARMNKRPSISTTQVMHLSSDGQIGIKLAPSLFDSIAHQARVTMLDAETSEAKRLMYVAMTRAKRELVMVWSAKLRKDGQPSLSGPAQWLNEAGMAALGEVDVDPVEEDEGVTQEHLTAQLDTGELTIRRLMLWGDMEDVERLDTGDAPAASPLPASVPTAPSQVSSVREPISAQMRGAQLAGDVSFSVRVAGVVALGTLGAVHTTGDAAEASLLLDGGNDELEKQLAALAILRARPDLARVSVDAGSGQVLSVERDQIDDIEAQLADALR